MANTLEISKRNSPPHFEPLPPLEQSPSRAEAINALNLAFRVQLIRDLNCLMQLGEERSLGAHETKLTKAEWESARGLEVTITGAALATLRTPQQVINDQELISEGSIFKGRYFNEFVSQNPEKPEFFDRGYLQLEGIPVEHLISALDREIYGLAHFTQKDGPSTFNAGFHNDRLKRINELRQARQIIEASSKSYRDLHSNQNSMPWDVRVEQEQAITRHQSNLPGADSQLSAGRDHMEDDWLRAAGDLEQRRELVLPPIMLGNARYIWGAGEPLDTGFYIRKPIIQTPDTTAVIDLPREIGVETIANSQAESPMLTQEHVGPAAKSERRGRNRWWLIPIIPIAIAICTTQSQPEKQSLPTAQPTALTPREALLPSPVDTSATSKPAMEREMPEGAGRDRVLSQIRLDEEGNSLNGWVQYQLALRNNPDLARKLARVKMEKGGGVELEPSDPELIAAVEVLKKENGDLLLKVTKSFQNSIKQNNTDKNLGPDNDRLEKAITSYHPDLDMIISQAQS